MRNLSAVIALAAGLGLAAPALADFSASARIGNAGSGVFVHGKFVHGKFVHGKFVHGKFVHGKFGHDKFVHRKFEHDKFGHGKFVHGKPRRDRSRFHSPHFLFFGSVRDEDDDWRLGRPAPLAPPPPNPDPPVAALPPEPPDPRGPTILRARGVAPASSYAVGEPLPASLPHVTLDWRQYDLPEPPAGRIYARIGRDVVLITADGRVVESVVPPG